MKKAHLLTMVIVSAAFAFSVIGCGGKDEPKDQAGGAATPAGSAGISILEQAVADDPGNVQLLIKLADAYKKDGQFNKALETLKKVPANADAATQATVKQLRDELITQTALKPYEEALRTDDPQKKTQLLLKARQLANDALQASPDSAPLHLLLGKVAYVEKKYDEALQRTNKALELSPDFLEAFSVKIECLRALDKPGQAYELGTKALAKADSLPQTEKTNEEKYRLCLQLAQMARTEGRLQQTSSSTELAAMDYYKKAVAAASKLNSKINAHFVLGKLYLDLNQFQNALDEAAAIEKIDKKTPTISYLKGRAEYGLAKQATGDERKEHLDAAIDRLSIFNNDSDPELLFYLGSAYSLRGGRNEQALATFNKALEILKDKQNTHLAYQIYCSMADVACRQSRYDLAEDYCQQAQRIQPKNDTRVMKSQAAIYFHQQDYRSAASIAAKIAELEPNSKEAKLSLARCRLLDGQPDLAQKIISKLDLSTESTPDVFALKGSICLQLRLYKEATEAYAQALKLDPTYSAAREGIAKALIASDRKDEAIRYLTDYAKQMPQEPQGPYFLGSIYEKEGNIDKALEYYHQALARAPEYYPGYDAARLHLVKWANSQAPAELDQAMNLWKQEYQVAQKAKIDKPDVGINLALALMLNNDNQTAKAYIDQMIGNFQQTRQLFVLGSIVNALKHQAYQEVQAQLQQVDEDKKAAVEKLIADCKAEPNNIEQLTLNAIETGKYKAERPDDYIAQILQGEYQTVKTNLDNSIKLSGTRIEYCLQCQVLIALHKKAYEEAQSYLPKLATFRVPVDRFIKDCREKADAANQVLKLFALAVIHHNSFKFDEAQAYLNQSLKLMPDNTLLLTYLAQVYRQTNKIDQFKQTCERMIANAPQFAWPYEELGKLAQSEQQLDQALGYYAKAADLDKENTDLRVRMAQILLQQQKPNQAQAVLDNIDAGGAQVDFLRLQVYRLQKKTESASALLQEMNRKYPDSPAVTKMQIDFLLTQAQEARRNNNDQQAQQYESNAINLCNNLLAKNRNDAQAYYLKARALLSGSSLQETREAVELLNKALEINDLDAQVYLTLASIFQTQFRLDAAMRILERGHGKLPENDSITSELARLYMQQNEENKAKKLLSQLPKNEQTALLQVRLKLLKAFAPDADNQQLKDEVTEQAKQLALSKDDQTAYEALCLLARMNINGQKNYAKAVTYFEEAKVKKPEAAEPTIQLAPLYFEMGRYDQSLAMLQKLNATAYNLAAQAIAYQALGDLPQAEDTVRKAFDDPQEPPNAVKMVLANILMARGRIYSTGGAMDSAEKAAASLSENLKQAYMQLAQDANRRGELALALNKAVFFDLLGWKAEVPAQYEDAVKIAQSRNQGQNLFLLSYHARSLIDLGRFDQAAQVLSQIEGKSVDAKVALADLLQREGKTDQAIQRYQQVLSQDPQNITVLLKMADLYAELAQGDRVNADMVARAIQLYEQALAAKPGNAGVQLRLGMLYQQLKQPEKALTHFEKAAELAPGTTLAANSLNNAAWLYATKDEPEFGKAIKAGTRARELAPTQPEVIDTLGWVHYLAGLKEAAAAELKTAATMLPEDGSVQYHYAKALADVAADLETAAKKLQNFDENATEEQRAKALADAKEKLNQAKAKRSVAIGVLQKALDLDFPIPYDKKQAQDLLAELQK